MTVYFHWYFRWYGHGYYILNVPVPAKILAEIPAMELGVKSSDSLPTASIFYLLIVLIDRFRWYT